MGVSKGPSVSSGAASRVAAGFAGKKPRPRPKAESDRPAKQIRKRKSKTTSGAAP
jgi:hypothetical protein